MVEATHVQTTRRIYLGVFMVALLVRAAFFFSALPTALLDMHQWSQSDSQTFLAVARQVLGGDLLVREPFHPYHLWHQQVADAQTWARWFGPGGFHQAPGYYYFLALLLWVTGGSLLAVTLVQLVMGALHAVVVAAAARRLGGNVAAWAGGLLVATYGPFIAVESQVLRDGPALLLASAALLLALQAREREESPRAWAWWMGCGAVLALGVVFKETGLVLAGAVAAWAAWVHLSHPRRSAWGPVTALAAGYLVGVSPLMVRNALVGVPLFALSAQGATNVLLGNAPGSPLGGRLFGIPPEFREVMDACQARGACALIEVLRRWSGNPAGFVAAVAGKAALAWRNVEVADNYSYAFFARRSVVLAVMPVFTCVSLPGLLGLAHAFVHHRAHARNMKQFHLLVAALLLQAAALSFAPVMARYRMIIVVPLILGMAHLVACCTAWARERARVPLLRVAGALAGILFAWVLVPRDNAAEARALRGEDFLLAANLLAARGDAEGARAEYDDAIRFCAGNPACEAPVREKRVQLARALGVAPDPADVEFLREGRGATPAADTIH